MEYFMVVSDETNGDENWARLLQMVPSAKRVANAGGILQSYQKCADQCQAESFFVIDGDNWVAENFHFEWPHAAKPGQVFVWRALNPVNGLIYGHGAIKLFCVADWRKTRSSQAGIDVTMGTGSTYNIVETLASEHRFNTSPFHTWRTAFRECVKLATHPPLKKGADIAAMRLNTWITTGIDRNFGNWSMLGAAQGAAFGRQYVDDLSALRKVNDYGWLQDCFRRASETLS